MHKPKKRAVKIYANSVKAKLPGTVSLLFSSILGWGVAVLLGVAGIFSARFFDFPNLLAAQATIGMFGLVGGLSHSILIKKAGGKVLWKQGLFISLVWALSCIGGVTPLFYTLGSSLKMAVLAFYSFAIFGAIGGVATAFMMRAFFENASSRDIVPCVIIWSFSFGFATIASDAAGDWLQIFMPELVAWSIVFLAMAIIIGGGGGYSIVQFLKEEKDERQAFETSMIDSKSSPQDKKLFYIPFLLFAPFYLNDFSNIFITDWHLWILIDYTTVKLFPFLILLWLIRNKKMQLSELGITTQSVIPFLTVFLIASLASLFIGPNGYLILKKLPGYPPLGGIPKIGTPMWNWIDLTFGLLMVGIFEELVFRGYMHAFLTRFTKRPLIIIGISAVAFGLIHWSGGFHKIVITSAIGALFMILYLRTRSLPAIMLAHFTFDFINFTNIIPRSIFSFIYD